jgi:hypothetical protein
LRRPHYHHPRSLDPRVINVPLWLQVRH